MFSSQIQSLQNEIRAVSFEFNSLSSTVTDMGNTLANLILDLEEADNQSVHTLTLHWNRETIPAKSSVQGYVKNYTTSAAIRIIQVDVWMGNPYNITWEGDVFVTINNITDPWNPLIDEVLIHYQFDSHASSSLPHQLSFDLRPGFILDSGKNLHVYRLFNNFDEKGTNAGDGWVRFYYLTE